MNFWAKLKTLHILKKRSFLILLAAEAVLLLIGIAGLFGRNAVYEYGPDNMKANFGSFREESGGYGVEAGEAEAGNLVDFGGITLPNGVYRVSLHYVTDTNMKNMCTVTDDTVGYKMMFTNGEHLYAGLNQTDFNMWLLADTAGMIVHAQYGGEGSLIVTGLTIRETNALSRMWIFMVLCGSLLVNAAYCYGCYDRKYAIPQKNKNVTFGLGLLILFSSLPAMTDYLLNSGDLVYHLMRVEGIRDGILSGQFPVRIAPEWQHGFGYASSVFYGETLLYIMAFFRMIGFTVLTSYRMFMVLLNGAVVLTAYFCFNRMFEDKYIGLLCSGLYSLSIYRLYKTFCSGSLGEAFGVLFLPLLAYGFYRVFIQDVGEKSYKRAWIPLTIGFTGLVQSHLLTGEQAGGFTVLLCILLWKKVFRKQTFLVLAKTVVYSVLLSAWFLVPFADYMLTGDYMIKHAVGRTIQYRGLYPAHLLFTYPFRGGSVFFDEGGMVDSDPMMIGFALLVALLLWALALFLGKTAKLEKKELALGKICGGFALLSLIMSLSLFPWDRIQFMNKITATLVSSLQFPNRFLTVATVCMTVLAGLLVKVLRSLGRERLTPWYYGLMAGLTLITSIFLIDDILYSTAFSRIYNGEGMGKGYIAGAEYLPFGTDAEQLVYKAPVAEENVTVEGWEKKALRVDVGCFNSSDREGFLELPLLYYKGYQAQDVDTGEPLTVYPGNNNLVSVSVPAGFQGTVSVRFVSPWYWRAAELLSVLTFVVLFLAVMRGKKIERKREV